MGTEEQNKISPKFREGGSLLWIDRDECRFWSGKSSNRGQQNEDGTWTLNGEKLWWGTMVLWPMSLLLWLKQEPKFGSREINKISAFIVETRLAGVGLHRCRFMGIQPLKMVWFALPMLIGEWFFDWRWGERTKLTGNSEWRTITPAISASGAEAQRSFQLMGKNRSQWGKQLGIMKKWQVGTNRLWSQAMPFSFRLLCGIVWCWW